MTKSATGVSWCRDSPAILLGVFSLTVGSQEEIIAKLRQIEDQARGALKEFPERVAKDRLRLILGIAGHLALKLETERTSELKPPASAPGQRRLTS